MAKRVFITATNTDIGKTYTTELLLKKLNSMGFRVGVIKPIETGVSDGYAPDGTKLLKLIKNLNSEFYDITLKDIVPITYKLPAAPFVASNGKKIDFKKIDKAIKKIEKRCDILIIEGAGGLLVPIDTKTMMIDLILHLKAEALLVTHCSLGCINDTLLSKNLLKQKNIKYLVAFNCRKDDKSFKKVSKPYFKKVGFKILKIDKDIDKISKLLSI